MAPLLFARSDQRALARLLARDARGLDDPTWNSFLDDAKYAYAAHAEGDETLFAFDLTILSDGNDEIILDFTRVPINIEAVYAINGDTAGKLTAKPLPQILSMRYEGSHNVGQPTVYAFDAQGGRTQWVFYFDRKATQNTAIQVWYRTEPIPYASDSDFTEYGDLAARTIARMAAADAAATVLGRSPDEVAGIEKRLPAALQFASGVAFKSRTHGGTDPRRAP